MDGLKLWQNPWGIQWWYHGTPREEGLALLDGPIRHPFFVTNEFDEAQFYGRDHMDHAEVGAYSRHLWVFRYRLMPKARVLDLTDLNKLKRIAPAGIVDQPDGSPNCWVRQAGFDAVAYDQAQFMPTGLETMFVEEYDPSGEIHLLVVNPDVLCLEAIWKGRAYRHWDDFTVGHWTILRKEAGRSA